MLESVEFPPLPAFFTPREKQATKCSVGQTILSAIRGVLFPADKNVCPTVVIDVSLRAA
jgi:hypothetical protein